MNGILSAVGLSVRLAGSDLRHDRRVALTMVVAIAAVLAPLLLLLGLKTGVVETAKRQLLSDPRNLEIRIYQNAHLDRQWFDAMRSRADVRFVIPRTRTINATIDLVTADRRILQSVEMIPSAAGDPLLSDTIRPPAGDGSVLLSTPAAAMLGLTDGDTFVGVLRRRLEGRDQRVEVPLRVAAVLPEGAMTHAAVFVTLPVLLAAEDYRDGEEVDWFTTAGERLAPSGRAPGSVRERTSLRGGARRGPGTGRAAAIAGIGSSHTGSRHRDHQGHGACADVRVSRDRSDRRRRWGRRAWRKCLDQRRSQAPGSRIAAFDGGC